jgi:hypothetical protein
MSTNFMDPRVPQRIWDKISPCPMSGCWLWTSSKHRLGYGDVWFERKRNYAHRVMYRLLVGEIPQGLELDHKCKTRICCNPDHLEAVTHTENMRRSRGWTHQAEKTHCPRGHSYDETAKIITRKRNGHTYRSCRICHSINQQAYMVRSGKRAA